jgi:aminoglycoside 3-N-acetyltransferase
LAVTKNDIRETIKKTGLVNKTVCVHSSLKSFGEVRGGSEAVVDAFLESGCTLVVPTFSFLYSIAPPADNLIAQNGIDYYKKTHWMAAGDKIVFSAKSNELDIAEMGAIPERVLQIKSRVRGDHPLCSFSAVGPFANEIIKTQAPMDVYAPLREAALFEGRVALIGVGLNRMTALHLAEQMAGRRMFVRWANGADKKPAMVETGGCSEGFCNLDPYVNHLDKKAQCGESPWRVFPMDKLLKQAARVIQLKPGTTHCGDPECLRCSDMAKGGPVL